MLLNKQIFKSEQVVCASAHIVCKYVHLWIDVPRDIS